MKPPRRCLDKVNPMNIENRTIEVSSRAEFLTALLHLKQPAPLTILHGRTRFKFPAVYDEREAESRYLRVRRNANAYPPDNASKRRATKAAPRGGSVYATVADLVRDDQHEAAYRLASSQGAVIIGAAHKASKIPGVLYVMVQPFEDIPDCYSCRDVMQRGGAAWSIMHAPSGLRVAAGKTRAGAEDAARQIDRERVLNALESVDKPGQSFLSVKFCHGEELQAAA